MRLERTRTLFEDAKTFYLSVDGTVAFAKGVACNLGTSAVLHKIPSHAYVYQSRDKPVAAFYDTSVQSGRNSGRMVVTKFKVDTH